MSRDDSRAVAQFLWSAAEGKDIILKSDGLRERSHCYVVDAVQGLLVALEKGESGQAYNIADRRYQMTIREFAERVVEAVGCNVKFELPSDIENKGYGRVSRQVLDALKLEKIECAKRASPDLAIKTAVSIMLKMCDESKI